MQIKFRQKIAVRQAKNTFLIALLIGVFLSILQIYYEFKKEKKQIRSTISLIIDISKDQAALAAISFSKDIADNIINGLLSYEPFYEVQIINDFGIVLSHKKRDYQHGTLSKLMEKIFRQESNFKVLLYNNENKKDSVGTLDISIDNYILSEKFIIRALPGILNIFILCLILSFILTLVFYYSLTLPILKMIKNLISITPNSPANQLLETPKSHEHDEIGLIIKSANQLLMGFEESLLTLKQAESALKESEQRYREIFENSVEGIFQVSADGRFINANKSMAKIFGYHAVQEFILSTSIEQCFTTPEKGRWFLKVLSQNGQVIGFETQGNKKDDSVFWGSISARVVHNKKDEVIFFEGSLVDITVIKQKEKAERDKEIMLEANRQLQQLDKMKSNFLSAVSHELRTPLTSILGFTKLILKDFNKFFSSKENDDIKLIKKTKQIEENLNIIIKEGERLTRLINDVLDIAKIESGKVEWHDTIFPISDLIDRAVYASSGLFSLKPEIKLLTSQNAVGVFVKADMDRLLQVLINLLNNASKFTNQGTIKIESSIYYKTINETEEPYVTICIEDTGIGISKNEIEKIFDRFHQASHGDTIADRPKGTGLGLSICKQIIEHYEGNIWAESELGKGSSFIFILPAFKKEEIENNG